MLNMFKILKNKKGQMVLLEVMMLFVITSLFIVISIGNLKIKLVDDLDKEQGQVQAEENMQKDKPFATVSTKKEYFYVLDEAGLLSNYTAKRISEKSKQLDLNSKAQIVVETLETMNGQNIESYSSKRFRELGLGDEKLNNGVLLVVVPMEKIARVEVGYGLEGAITDVDLGRIVREQGLKRFEEQNFEKGISDVYFAIAEEVSKEYTPSARKGSEGGAGVTVKWK